MGVKILVETMHPHISSTLDDLNEKYFYVFVIIVVEFYNVSVEIQSVDFYILRGQSTTT